MKKINLILVTLLCLNTITRTYGQDKKLIKASKGLPENVLLSRNQFPEFKNCEVCSVREKLPNGNIIYYQYDRMKNTKIQPEGTTDITFFKPNRARTIHIYKYPNGEKLIKYTYHTKGVLQRPIPEIRLSKDYIDKEQSEPPWSFYEDIKIYTKIKGSTTSYKVCKKYTLEEIYPGTEWLSHSDDLDRTSIFMKKLDNGFFQLLLNDYSLFPANADDETQGFIPFKDKPNLIIEVVKINGELKYYLNRFTIEEIKISKKETKKKMVFTRLHDEAAEEYFIFEGHTDPGYHTKVEPTIFLKSGNKHYSMGPPDSQIIFSIELHSSDYDNYTLWFEGTDLNEVITLTQLKWENTKKSNKEHWKFIDYRNALSAERRRVNAETEKNNAEYKKALTDYKECIHKKLHYSSCKIGSWTNVLSEDVMIQISNNREQNVKDKREHDAILTETIRKRNNVIHITDEMKKKGYRVVKWDGKKWK